jgi:hypothetical protein
VFDYGATGDGVTDDYADIASAISACSAAGGGVVFLPPGVFLISSLLTVPSSVSLQGSGAAQNPGDAATVLRCTASGAGVLFSGDGGTHRDFYVDGSTAGTDGSAVANQPFRRVGGVSGATFINIIVRYALQDGHLCTGAQNDTYIECKFLNSQRYSGLWDDGAGGLTYIGCDFSSALATNNARFQETFTTGGYPYPTDIAFYKCRFEYIATNNPCVYHSSGERIRFTQCLFGQRYASSYTGAIFHQVDSAVGHVMIEAPQFTGYGLTGNSCIRVGASVAAPMSVDMRGGYANTVSYIYDAASAAAQVRVLGDPQLGAGVTKYKPSTVIGAIQTWTHGRMIVERPASTDDILQGYVTGESDVRVKRNASGQDSYGDGGGTFDTVVGRLGANLWGTASGDKLIGAAGVGVGNSAAATEVIGKAVVKKIEVFDASGTSLGFVPVYSSIT